MGAACAEPSPVPELAGEEDFMTIYGDFFDSDTRSLLAISEIVGADLTHSLVDRFRKDHEKPEYVAINPTQTIPMIKYGDMKVFGPGIYLFDVFFEQNFIAKRIFCPDAFKDEIDETSKWQ